MAVFGVSVSITIVAVGGGFSSPGPSFLNPPSTSDMWAVGDNIRAGSILNYSLTKFVSHDSPWNSLGMHSSLVDSLVSLEFDHNDNNKWETTISITNGTIPMAISREDTILLSNKQLTNAGPIAREFIPYYEPLESSILEVRDIALQPEYLTIGAEWNSITGDVVTIPVKVTAQEKIRTNAGIFNTYVLSYTLNSKTSRIWIDHDIPLPIKAEVYDEQDKLQYRYTLVFYKR